MSCVRPPRDALPNLYALPGRWSGSGGASTPSLDREVRAEREVYVGIATRRDTSSGSASNLLQLPAVRLEYDHATARLPMGAVADRAFPFPVSLKVLSGGGMGASWYLREPLDVTTIAAQVRVTSVLRQRYCGAARRGPDATDAARILRLVDTANHKYGGEPRPVVFETVASCALNLE